MLVKKATGELYDIDIHIYIYMKFIHISNVDNSSEFMKMRKYRSTWCVYIATAIAVHFVYID